MPSESSERSPASRAQNTTHPPPKTTEPLPCPRCNSTTTKFCYYNNYNLSQPRYFCKSCRRYWTQGGALRNVPVGGGTRKNSKRSRSTSNSSTSSSASNSTASNSTTLTALTAHEPSPSPVPAASNTEPTLPVVKTEATEALNLNECLPLTENQNFLSLLNSHNEHGLIGLAGYGYGSDFGYGPSEVGVGFGGRGLWSYPGLGIVNDENVGASGVYTSACNTWQLQGDAEGGGHQGGFVDGDNNYFGSWPAGGLVISTAGRSSN